MIYKVLAIQTWGFQLGVVGYLTDGELFESIVTRTVEKFPKMKIAIPVSAIDRESVYRVLKDQMPTYLHNFKIPATRAELGVMKQFLDSLNAEYRRWNFDAGVESSVDESMYDELKPLIEIHGYNRQMGGSINDVFLEYATQAMADLFADAFIHEFEETITTFTRLRKGGISELSLTLDFPQCNYNLMDMRLLITVPEE